MYKYCFDSPIGTITCYHREGKLHRLVLPVREGKVFSENLPEKDFPLLKDYLISYFENKGKDMNLMNLDIPVNLNATPEFTTKVLMKVKEIPWGRTVTYKEISLALEGRPDYSRAVGNALKANPCPIVISCHRVIKSDGGLGGFSGGMDLKRWLLNFEGR